MSNSNPIQTQIKTSVTYTLQEQCKSSTSSSTLYRYVDICIKVGNQERKEVLELPEQEAILLVESMKQAQSKPEKDVVSAIILFTEKHPRVPNSIYEQYLCSETVTDVLGVSTYGSVLHLQGELKHMVRFLTSCLPYWECSSPMSGDWVLRENET